MHFVLDFGGTQLRFAILLTSAAGVTEFTGGHVDVSLLLNSY